MSRAIGFQRCCVPLVSSAVIAALTLLVACDQGPEPPAEEFPPDPDLPEAVVDLPDPPPDSAFEIRKRNDDDSLRVEGIIGHRDQFMDEQVEVRGVVSDIIGADCDPSVERCPRLHLLVRDHMDEDLDLIIVGFEDTFLRTAGISEGDEYLFAGTYTDMADGFVSTEEGLIDLKAVDDHEVPDDDD